MYKFVRGLMTSRPSSVKGVEIWLHTRRCACENIIISNYETNDCLIY